METPSQSSTVVASDRPAPPPTFTPLKSTTTSISAHRAAATLESFATSPENPLNWPNRKKWRIALTVALTGFISTFGSSVGVPGIYAIRDDFGVDNEKVGILVTTAYVLGLGRVNLEPGGI